MISKNAVVETKYKDTATAKLQFDNGTKDDIFIRIWLNKIVEKEQYEEYCNMKQQQIGEKQGGNKST